MSRRITETYKVNRENERLMILTIYEEGISKEAIKKENPLSKKHYVLYESCGSYEIK